MDAVTKLFLAIFMLFVAGYNAPSVHSYVQKMFAQRLSKGFSSTESFSNKLTGQKTPF